MIKKRNPWLALLGSLACPGLGQIYNGQVRKGLFISFLLLIPISVPYLLAQSIFVIAISSILRALLVTYAAIDSIHRAVHFGKEYSWRRFNRWQIYIFFIAAVMSIDHAIDWMKIPRLKPFAVPGASMAPALLNGDNIYALIHRACLHCYHPIQRGDIWLFRYPREPGTVYAKRIIALPGDTVEYKNHKLILNKKEVEIKFLENDRSSELLESDYDKASLRAYEENLNGARYKILFHSDNKMEDYGPVTVPNGKLFVMGDNRDRSSDSRAWGFVPIENFIGKIEFIYFSWDILNKKIRWSRIGKNFPTIE